MLSFSFRTTIYQLSFFFFFNDTATTEIYTLSLHDALPIWRWCGSARARPRRAPDPRRRAGDRSRTGLRPGARSEEHTSELQSQSNLVCRLLLEKKKKNNFKLGQLQCFSIDLQRTHCERPER